MPAFEVLVVCVGNVCRSPFAERLLAKRLADAGAASGDFSVRSAGTLAAVGSPMHPEMARRLAAVGGSAEGFVSRQLTRPMIERAGLVLTATRDLRARVLQEEPSAFRRTFTILELAAVAPTARRGAPLTTVLRAASARRSAGAEADLLDPINRSAAVYDGVAASIDTATDAILDLMIGNLPDDHTTSTGTRIAR